MWGRVLGKKVRFERCSVEFYEELFLEKGYPEGCGRELGEMYEFMGDWGYGKLSPSDLNVVPIMTRLLEGVAAASM